jgi:hypothetical protein
MQTCYWHKFVTTGITAIDKLNSNPILVCSQIPNTQFAHRWEQEKQKKL